MNFMLPRPRPRPRLRPILLVLHLLVVLLTIPTSIEADCIFQNFEERFDTSSYVMRMQKMSSSMTSSSSSNTTTTTTTTTIPCYVQVFDIETLQYQLTNEIRMYEIVEVFKADLPRNDDGDDEEDENGDGDNTNEGHALLWDGLISSLPLILWSDTGYRIDIPFASSSDDGTFLAMMEPLSRCIESNNDTAQNDGGIPSGGNRIDFPASDVSSLSEIPFIVSECDYAFSPWSSLTEDDISFLRANVDADVDGNRTFAAPTSSPTTPTKSGSPATIEPPPPDDGGDDETPPPATPLPTSPPLIPIPAPSSAPTDVDISTASPTTTTTTTTSAETTDPTQSPTTPTSSSTSSVSPYRHGDCSYFFFAFDTTTTVTMTKRPLLKCFVGLITVAMTTMPFFLPSW